MRAAGQWLDNVARTARAVRIAHAAGVCTDPDEAADYVHCTGVDALAVAVGTSHAMTTCTASVDTALIRRVRDRLSTPLVLHGSSGVPDDQLRAAARAGIRLAVLP